MEHTCLDDLIDTQIEEENSKYDDLYKEYEDLPQYEKFYKR